MSDKKLPEKSSAKTVAAFLQKAASTPPARTGTAGKNRGRLIFALDATASREASWDHASHLQTEMFQSTAQLGGLDIQLCYYRGFGEFHPTPWLADSRQLLHEMTAVHCLAGHTQIGKLLQHALRETRKQKVNAVVFIGDCVEENIDSLGQQAGQLGLLGVPLFLFHEGHDANAAHAFRHLAELSGGAYCPFDAGSAQQLRDLLAAVAVFAVGGHSALTDFHRRHGSTLLKLTRR